MVRFEYPSGSQEGNLLLLRVLATRVYCLSCSRHRMRVLFHCPISDSDAYALSPMNFFSYVDPTNTATHPAGKLYTYIHLQPVASQPITPHQAALCTLHPSGQCSCRVGNLTPKDLLCFRCGQERSKSQHHVSTPRDTQKPAGSIHCRVVGSIDTV